MTSLEQRSDLIRELVESYIDHPRDLTLEGKPFASAVYWSMRGHADDYGKLVGKRGAHVNALAFLVRIMGHAQKELHSFKLEEPSPGERREAAPAKAAETYDPRPARDLLCRLLEALDIGQFVVEAKVERNLNPRVDFPLFVRFEIGVRSHDDYEVMVMESASSALTVIGSLGMLFRARANKEGVGVQLDVVHETATAKK